jgi:hypothetical protein
LVDVHEHVGLGILDHPDLVDEGMGDLALDRILSPDDIPTDLILTLGEGIEFLQVP